ncbi:type II secretion system protein GspD, partial [Simkania negevensis]|nr:type II secretion system protein GspD [Simkania negevensis]
MDVELTEELAEVNRQLYQARIDLETIYVRAQALYQSGAPEEELAPFLEEIERIKKIIWSEERSWRNASSERTKESGYALWHQPETTLAQLVMAYGSQDFLYLVPEELKQKKLTVASTLAVPRESWDEVLRLALEENGVGVKELSPFVRQLYIYKDNASVFRYILDSQEALQVLPDDTRICYFFHPMGGEVHRTVDVLKKFSNATTTVIRVVGDKVAVIASVGKINEFIKLHDFVATQQAGTAYALIPLTRMNADEAEKILKAVFKGRGYLDRSVSNAKNSEGKEDGDGLLVIAMKERGGALFLMGPEKLVARAQATIEKLESSMAAPTEKTVYWYTCKHSEAEEVAKVLHKVYGRLVSEPSLLSSKTGSPPASKGNVPEPTNIPHSVPNEDRLIVAPSVISPHAFDTSNDSDASHGSFIVDSKTGSIIMVVEKRALSELKELIKKIDVPKQMVQVEVLLFEKKINDQTNFGLNLLRMGSSAGQEHATGLSWDNRSSTTENKGILAFILSRAKASSGFPAYDVAYNFLLSQEDVQINASPSITTVNQTPAQIALVEEISVNTGVIELDSKSKNATLLKDSYARMQYGITIELTPTINSGGNDEEKFITLATDITFDTTKPSKDNRPEVSRRHITNEVRIADGQTVILGGLRRKITTDSKESIPFLGEIPGVGKLFSSTVLTDQQTEMFVFLTPKIIADPIQDIERLRIEALQRRPGDIPEFLSALHYAREQEKSRAMRNTMHILFGNEKPTKGSHYIHGDHREQ